MLKYFRVKQLPSFNAVYNISNQIQKQCLQDKGFSKATRDTHLIINKHRASHNAEASGINKKINYKKKMTMGIKRTKYNNPDAFECCLSVNIKCVTLLYYFDVNNLFNCSFSHISFKDVKLPRIHVK